MTKIVAAVVGVGWMTLTGCFAHPGGEAASNDSAAMSTGQFAVDTASQLPDCDETTEAYIAYVKDESHVVTCHRGSWTAKEIH